MWPITAQCLRPTPYTINGVAADLGGAVAKGSEMAIVTDSNSRIENLDVDAFGGAIAVRGLKYDDGAGGMMRSTQVIYAKGGASAGWWRVHSKVLPLLVL